MAKLARVILVDVEHAPPGFQEPQQGLTRHDTARYVTKPERGMVTTHTLHPAPPFPPPPTSPRDDCSGCTRERAASRNSEVALTGSRGVCRDPFLAACPLKEPPMMRMSWRGGGGKRIQFKQLEGGKGECVPPAIYNHARSKDSTTVPPPPHHHTHTHTPTQPRDPADFVAKQLLTTTVTQLEVGR